MTIVAVTPRGFRETPGRHQELLAASGFEVRYATQERPLGTGDAARAARAALEGFDGDVLLLSGDVPGLTPGLLRDLVSAHRSPDVAATVLSFRPPDVRAYGRIVREQSILRRLVEAGTRIVHMGYSGTGDVDDMVDRAVEAIVQAARTGRIGDGKIFVQPIA